MPLVPLFSASQSVGSPNLISLLDVSTGSDVAVTSRVIYLLTSTGEYIVPTGVATDYVNWPLATNPISLDVLQQDMALSIRVDWIDIASAVLYTKTIAYSFTLYTLSFLYSLTQDQVANNTITQDQNYYNNKLILFVEMQSANNAIAYASDIVSAQSCLNRAANLIQNESFYF